MTNLRVVIDGSHCTGKTSLLNSLAQHDSLCDFDFTGEVAKRVALQDGVITRAQMEQLLASPARYDLFLRRIHCEQRRQERLHSRFVSDSSLFRNLAYALATGRTLDLFGFDFMGHRYDLVLYCPIEFDFVTDGFRFEPLRSEVDRYLREVLYRYDQPVVEVHGPVENRLKQALRAIETLRNEH